MSSAFQPIRVRWQGAGDAHSESVVRVRMSGSQPLRHMHWPQPAVVDVEEARLLAEVEGNVVGRVVIDAVYPPFGELVNMEVLPAFRGRGAGGALVDELVACLAQMGFMAAFLQTQTHLTPALRLYARKGFLLAARGQMLRLVRFLNLPLLDWFRYGHPLAVYGACQGEEPGTWRLAWSDWPTGDRLELRLTGGSSDKGSDDYGPGLDVVALSTDELAFEARLSGPREARRGDQLTLGLKMGNTGLQSLPVATRLLLPVGCSPTGESETRGPAARIEPGQSIQFEFVIALDVDLDLRALSYSSWLSLPLTIEAFVGDTSFWLTHTLMVDGVKDLVPERGKGARSISRARLSSLLPTQVAARG